MQKKSAHAVVAVITTEAAETLREHMIRFVLSPITHERRLDHAVDNLDEWSCNTKSNFMCGRADALDGSYSR